MGEPDDDVLFIDGPATPRRRARSGKGTVSWAQVQAFLDMAQLALQAKTQANEKLAEQVSSVQKDLAKALEDLSKGRTSNFLYLADSDSLLTAALTQKTKELAAANQEASKLESQRNDLEGQLKLAEDALEDRHAQLESYKVEVTQLQQSLQEVLHHVEVEKEELEQQISQLQQDKSSLEDAIMILQGQNSRQADQLMSMQNELEAKLLKMQIGNGKLEMIIRRQQEDMTVIAKSVIQVSVENSRLEAEYSTLQSQTKKETDKLQAECKELEFRLGLSRANGEYLGKFYKENRSPVQQLPASKLRTLGQASPLRSRSVLRQSSEEAGKDNVDPFATASPSQAAELTPVDVEVGDTRFLSAADATSLEDLEDLEAVNYHTSFQDLPVSSAKEEANGRHGSESNTFQEEATYSSPSSPFFLEPVTAN